MKITYKLDQAGWANTTIADDGKHRNMIVSYLSDALCDMTQATICILEGADSVRFSFHCEPGEHRFIINRTSDAEVQIRVLWYEDLWSKLSEEI